MPRATVIWVLGLVFGIVAGALSLYLIAGAPSSSTSVAAAAPQEVSVAAR